ncbi:MAG: AGE family epimerase/isomerase [Daejeonella sp.]|nr:AGE family epimerase/isomerase [Daejeonella sp.]
MNWNQIISKLRMSGKSFSRRNFIRSNAIAGIGLSGLAGLSGFAVDSSESENSVQGKSPIKTLAGLNLQQLHDRYHDELFKRFLPAMESLCIDPVYGGFMCDVDISERKLVNTIKRVWNQGRGIWVYSFLYNNFEKNPRYLEVAKKAIDFILKLKPKDDNFFDGSYSREGNRISGPGDIYGNLFVAEGLAEYAKASGDKSYLKIAKEMILTCLEQYDRPDYVYDISYVPGKPKMQGPRNLGHWMIFLSLSSQILTQGPDPELEKLADRCIDAIMKQHVNEEFNILNEVRNHDFTLPKNEYADFAVIGHGIETLAFVMAEAVRRKDPALFIASEAAFKRHVDVAADKLYGGHFEVLYNANTYSWSPSKSAWCQQEVSIGALLSIEHTGNTWAHECFSEGDAYMLEKMSCPDYAFWTFGGNRKVVNPSTKTIEHYHMPRYLMRNMLALQRIMKRKGKLSDLIS